jgi:hypothetical protein
MDATYKFYYEGTQFNGDYEEHFGTLISHMVSTILILIRSRLLL